MGKVKQDMGAEILSYSFLYLGLILVIAAMVFMIWDRDHGRYSKLKQQLLETSQNNLRVVQQSQDLATRNAALDKQNTELQGLVSRLNTRLASLETEHGLIQEHCARLREGQIQLQDKLSKRRPKVEIPRGPIQIEIHTGKKASESGSPPNKAAKRGVKNKNG